MIGAPLQGGTIGQVTLANTLLRWTIPGELNTTENSYIARLFVDEAITLKRLKGILKVAATGQSIILTFKKGTIGTGALTSTIGTLTILAGAFTGETDLGVGVEVEPTEFVELQVSQVGSVLPGETLTAIGFTS